MTFLPDYDGHALAVWVKLKVVEDVVVDNLTPRGSHAAVLEGPREKDIAVITSSLDDGEW